MDQTEQNAQAAAEESIAEEKVEDSGSNLTAETGQQPQGGLAQLAACYREIDDDDSSDDSDRY